MLINSTKIYLGRVNWSFVGVILALILGLFSIYVFFDGENPNITFDIVNEVNVFDVHKPLDELNIYFREEDIQQKNLNLLIISIKIENTGNLDILQNFYDENVVFGLQVDNGQIIESRLVDSNSEYLMSNLNLETVNNTVEFSKLIFEENKYFIIEILVLHDKNEGPTLVPLGKIAGIEKMEVIKSYTERQSFFDVVFSGSLVVQMIRLPIYLSTFIAFLLSIALVSDQIDKRRIRRRKHQRSLLVDKLDSFDGNLTSKNKEIIKNILICIPQDKWKEVLNSLKAYKFDIDILKVAPDELFDEFCKQYDGYSFSNKPIAAYTDDYIPFSTYNTMVTIGSYLNKHKLLGEKSDQDNLSSFEGSKLKVNVQFLKDLKSSISYLENI